MSDGTPTRPVPSLPEAFGDDGRYRVTGQLGTGGMGLVVRARDRLLERDVAIKVLADNFAADEDARARFLREARSAAAIHHPQVVAVHDVGEQDGRPYLVMECVDGRSLAEVLRADGPLPGDDVVDAAIDALAGLASAHDADLLHRDVKPGNLLRDHAGTVKVSDFGVAVAADGPTLTRAGFVMGTAGYLAPERRRGEPATVATDLWALGATLLELLTDHHPSPEADAALAARGGDVPDRLRVLLEQLLAQDPADRPASAHDARAFLDPSTAERSPATPLPTGTDGGATAARTSGEVTAALPSDRTADERTADAGTADPTEAVDVPPSGSTGPAGGDLTRWTRVAIAAGLLLVAVLVVQLVTGGTDPSTPSTGFQVEIDDDDPAGTARDLAERLRDRGSD